MSLPRNKKLKESQLSSQLHEISVKLRNTRLQDIKHLREDADRLYNQGIIADENGDISQAIIFLTEAITKHSRIPEKKRDNNDMKALCRYHLGLALINFKDKMDLDKMEHEYAQAKMYFDKIILLASPNVPAENVRFLCDENLRLSFVSTHLLINYCKELIRNQELSELLDSPASKHHHHHHHHHKNKTAAKSVKSGDSALAQNTIFANANIDAKTTNAPAADTQSMSRAKI